MIKKLVSIFNRPKKSDHEKQEEAKKERNERKRTKKLPVKLKSSKKD